MVGRTEYSNVNTLPDFDYKYKRPTKYSFNDHSQSFDEHYITISKVCLTLIVIGLLILAGVAAILTYLFAPNCISCPSNGFIDRLNTSTSTECFTDHKISNSKSLSNNSNVRIPSEYISTMEPLTTFRQDDGMATDLDKEVDVNDGRLPRSVIPHHYNLNITAFLENGTTEGSVVIYVHVEQQTNLIILHLDDLVIKNVSITLSDAVYTINELSYLKGQRYRIIVDEPLDINRTYALKMQFKGKLNQHLQGFYQSNYQHTDESYRTLASTQFSPVDARRAFPCFDEPALKATFNITIGHIIHLHALSNMPLQSSEIYDNRVYDTFATTPKMPTYLVAFIISDLDKSPSSSNQMKIWTRSSLLHETNYAAEFAPKVLSFFESYLKTPFPLSKIDLFAVPAFGFSAMENWGLITFRESVLLCNVNGSDVDNVRNSALVVAHELAHQWFGNLVTPKWWNDLWLKEGFATYFQYISVHKIEPDWNIKEEFLLSETARVFTLDALSSSRPISLQVRNSKQIRQVFDELSYGKGACLVRMMKHFLGEEIFKEGLIQFLRQYKYGNADRFDLFRSLTAVAHERKVLNSTMSVEQIMSSWTNNPGFPVITAIADYANNLLILSQKRFLYVDDNKKETLEESNTWWVPISIATASKPTFTITSPSTWLKGEYIVSIKLKAAPWYLLNLHQTAYYIVNYDTDNWIRLTDRIMEFPTLIRAQLISDSMDLARANQLDYAIPLRLIARMVVQDKDIMYVPTAVALLKLQYLYDMLADQAIFGQFESYHSEIFKHAYNAITKAGFQDLGSYLKNKIRKAVMEWSCRSPLSECSIRAQGVFRDWMEFDRDPHANVRDVVYCTAIREGTNREWDFVYHKFKRSKSPATRNALLLALGCTKQHWLASRYLNALLYNGTSIKAQDAGRVFESVASNRITHGLAFNFLREHWDDLINRYGDGFNIMSKMVKHIARHMKTKFQLDAFIKFRDEKLNNLGANKQAFDIAIEQVRGNVMWMQKQYGAVALWLHENKYQYTHL